MFGAGRVRRFTQNSPRCVAPTLMITNALRDHQYGQR
jgi:hypothetical protein